MNIEHASTSRRMTNKPYCFYCKRTASLNYFNPDLSLNLPKPEADTKEKVDIHFTS